MTNGPSMLGPGHLGNLVQRKYLLHVEGVLNSFETHWLSWFSSFLVEIPFKTVILVSNTDGHRLNNGLTYDFPPLWWCRSNTRSVENVLWILIFFFPPGLGYAVATLLWSWVPAASHSSCQPCCHETKQLTLLSFSIKCIFNLGLFSNYDGFIGTWPLCKSRSIGIYFQIEIEKLRK